MDFAKWQFRIFFLTHSLTPVTLWPCPRTRPTRPRLTTTVLRLIILNWSVRTYCGSYIDIRRGVLKYHVNTLMLEDNISISDSILFIFDISWIFFSSIYLSLCSLLCFSLSRGYISWKSQQFLGFCYLCFVLHIYISTLYLFVENVKIFNRETYCHTASF